MKQLDTTIAKLKSDPYFGIRVINRKTAQPIISNATGAILTEKYGSVENFFEGLYADDIRELIIVPRRKNGSEFRAFGDQFNIDFEDKQSDVATSQSIAPLAAPAQNPPAALMGGMNATSFYNAMDYERLKTENTRLIMQNDNYKSEVDALKLKVLQNEYSDSRAKGNQETLKGIMEVLPTLLPLLGKGSAPGLTGASYSPTKTAFITSVANADDALIVDLSIIARGMENNPTFDAELTALLAKHQLIVTENVAN